MPPTVAFLACVFFVLWLFIQDRKWHQGASSALWIPLAWLVILGSRPVTVWLGVGGQSDSADDYLEGSPLDRVIFLALIVGGLVLLSRRRLNWSEFIANNRWVWLFFIYLGISTLWSDYPFVSFKRWIKDVGNVVMVLIVLTEQSPISAIKALLARCTYLLIPFSILLIKYYPDLGLFYNRWDHQRYYTGVTTDKNMLGMTLFVCGLSLVWIWIELVKNRKGSRKLGQTVAYLVLAAMIAWLLSIARSSTALTCTVLGAGVLLSMQLPRMRDKVRRMGLYGPLAIVALLILGSTLNLGETLANLVGRDLTFTGRTEIWEQLLNEDVNPAFGVGYYSFWLGDRVERLSAKYYYLLNEAHNGYLETYLNSGLIGLALLVGVLLCAGRKILRSLVGVSCYSDFRLAFLTVTIVYNITEAAFNRLNLIWFILLLVVIETDYPDESHTESSLDRTDEGAPQVLPDHAGFLRDSPRILSA